MQSVYRCQVTPVMFNSLGPLWTVAHQAPLSMGFSRQEYWSGLPCPPPRDLPDPRIELAYFTTPALAGRFFTTSTTWEAHTVCLKVKVKVAQSCLTLCDPMDYTDHGILQARILEWVAFPFSRVSSHPRDQTQVSRIAGRFFTSWATRKPKNTEMSSLSLLQQIFSTQEPNWGLLHCRWILYQLSY